APLAGAGCRSLFWPWPPVGLDLQTRGLIPKDVVLLDPRADVQPEVVIGGVKPRVSILVELRLDAQVATDRVPCLCLLGAFVLVLLLVLFALVLVLLFGGVVCRIVAGLLLAPLLTDTSRTR